MKLKLGFVGFGEAGYHITNDYDNNLVELYAFDRSAFSDTEKGAFKRARAEEHYVTLVKTLEDLANCAEIILCLTSAGNALPIAEEIFPYLRKEHVYIDLNSTSPALKESIGKLFEEGGKATFVGGAIMSSVPQNKTRVPIFLSGPSAENAERRLNVVGMNTKTVSTDFGKATAMKMINSVLAKGCIALYAEAVFCADKYGVTEYILENQKDIFEKMGHRGFCDYMVASAAVHNARFIHEMENVIETVEAVNENCIMTKAALNKFEWLNEQGFAGHFIERPTTFQQVLDVKHEIDK